MVDSPYQLVSSISSTVPNLRISSLLSQSFFRALCGFVLWNFITSSCKDPMPNETLISSLRPDKMSEGKQKRGSGMLGKNMSTYRNRDFKYHTSKLSLGGQKEHRKTHQKNKMTTTWHPKIDLSNNSMTGRCLQRIQAFGEEMVKKRNTKLDGLPFAGASFFSSKFHYLTSQTGNPTPPQKKNWMKLLENWKEWGRGFNWTWNASHLGFERFAKKGGHFAMWKRLFVLVRGIKGQSVNTKPLGEPKYTP